MGPARIKYPRPESDDTAGPLVDIRFTIPLPPRTKKNHQNIRRSRKTGGLYIGQSKYYTQYERACMMFIPHAVRVDVDQPVNIRAIYYMEKNARVDITNLHSALHDVLTKAGVLKDDSSLRPRIVAGTDGSRVYVDPKNPRTEIIITSFDGKEEDGDGP